MDTASDLHAVSLPPHSSSTPQKRNKPIFFLYLEMQNPQGNPLSINPPVLLHHTYSQQRPCCRRSPRSSRNPPAMSFWGSFAQQRACLRICAFSPAAPRCQLGEDFFFHWVFVSFENTPCLCCSFSAAQCPSPFPRPGARASVRSRRSEVAGVAGHPRASGTDKVPSAANVSRGNGALKAHPLETIYKALSPL